MSKPKEYGLMVSVMLDSSGSMSNYIDPTLKAFDEFVLQLGHAIQPATITAYTFSNGVKKIGGLDKVPVYDAPKLRMDDYWIGGGTETARCVWNVVNDMEQENATQKVLVILTDGEGVASGGVTYDQVKERIERHRKDGWLVLLLGVDGVAIMEGKKLGIPAENCLIFQMHTIKETMVAAAAASLRFGQSGKARDAAFTEEERKAAFGGKLPRAGVDYYEYD